MKKAGKWIIVLLLVLAAVLTVRCCDGVGVANETTATQMELQNTQSPEVADGEIGASEGTEEPATNPGKDATEITEATEVTEPEKVTEAPTEETNPADSGSTQPSQDQKPDVTEPAATNPPATEPPVTNPPATEPIATNPSETESPSTEPPITEPPVTNPPTTDPPETDPPETEPPAPTECEHDWEIISHQQEGYWTDPYVVCRCGAAFATEPEWWAHAQYYTSIGEYSSHMSWGGAQDFIEISPCYYEWICKKCGHVEVYYV